MRPGIDKRAMTLLSAGHLGTDFANGALPALLPFLVDRFGLSYTLAADAPSYWLVLLLVVVSGVGVAAYHPEGSKFAAYASGRRRASGMSAFSIGGNVGFALGPVVATPLVVPFGLRGGLLLALPCLAIAAVLLAGVPFLRTFEPEGDGSA